LSLHVADFLLDSLFDPKGGDDMFLWSIKLFLTYRLWSAVECALQSWLCFKKMYMCIPLFVIQWCKLAPFVSQKQCSSSVNMFSYNVMVSFISKVRTWQCICKCATFGKFTSIQQLFASMCTHKRKIYLEEHAYCITGCYVGSSFILNHKEWILWNLKIV
jgi:hypothetical protein